MAAGWLVLNSWTLTTALYSLVVTKETQALCCSVVEMIRPACQEAQGLAVEELPQ